MCWCSVSKARALKVVSSEQVGWSTCCMSCFESRGGTSSCGQFWLLEFGATRTSCNDHICGTDMMTARRSLQNLPSWMCAMAGWARKGARCPENSLHVCGVSVIHMKQTGCGSVVRQHPCAGWSSRDGRCCTAIALSGCVLDVVASCKCSNSSDEPSRWLHH